MGLRRVRRRRRINTFPVIINKILSGKFKKVVWYEHGTKMVRNVSNSTVA